MGHPETKISLKTADSRKNQCAWGKVIGCVCLSVDIKNASSPEPGCSIY